MAFPSCSFFFFPLLVFPHGKHFIHDDGRFTFLSMHVIEYVNARICYTRGRIQHHWRTFRMHTDCALVHTHTLVYIECMRNWSFWGRAAGFVHFLPPLSHFHVEAVAAVKEPLSILTISVMASFYSRLSVNLKLMFKPPPPKRKSPVMCRSSGCEITWPAALDI